MPGSKEPVTLIVFGPFEADLPSQELRKQGHRLRLPRQSFQILKMLLGRPGQLVMREELRQALWPSDTFVDFEHSLNAAIGRLREALGDDADNPRYIETLPRRGYRFIGTNTPPAATNAAAKENIGGGVQKGTVWKVIVPAAIAVAALAAGGYFYLHPNPKLTDKDTIVLSDFTNTTGDIVFDGTLRQGLTVQLEQSPFLSLVPDQRIQQTLRLMGRPPDAKLTPEISRELCQRIGSKAVIDGSIAQIGTQYSLILKVVNCSNGESLTSTETLASDKSHVLDALGKAGLVIRNKLGESIGSVQKLNTPLEQATTPSLEALQFFSLGVKSLAGGDAVSAMPLFRQAIKLDPNFALAYGDLGISYMNLGESRLASDNLRRAYELRERASEIERLFIEAHYHWMVNGDLEKAERAFGVLVQVYPRFWAPRNDLGVLYEFLGQYDKALAEYREALRLNSTGATYAIFVRACINLNRLEEARATAIEAQAKNLDSPYLHSELYLLASLQNDTAEMTKQVEWATGKPGIEDQMLQLESWTTAISGKNVKAREFSNRAVTSAERAEEKGMAAGYEADTAVREAFFGNAVEARQRAGSALGLSTGPYVQYGAALALAMAGDIARAQSLADDLDKRFPEDTIVQFSYLPTLRAQLALTRNDPSTAIEALQAAAQYELGFSYALVPVYVRGEAYLAAQQGTEAAAEFQKILDHRGIVANRPIGALAYLGLARSYAMQGDTAKARAAYQDFLTLWKDADPDVPILKQAKAEYAKLQ